MLSTTDVTMSENARIFAKNSRSSVAGSGSQNLKQRAEGEFLRKVVAELQPMLHQTMRSRRIFLARDAYGTVMLKSDGLFVHVDFADQEDTFEPVQVLAAEPNLLTLLSDIEAELGAVADPRASRAAGIVRLARYSLAAAAAA